MPLPIYATQAEVPAADAADFVEYKGKWHQKDWVAATTEAERVKGINATLITEKTTAETAAATEKARADTAEAAAKTGKTVEELDAYANTKLAPVATERDTLKTDNATLKAKLDRTELEKLVRKSATEAGLMVTRLDDEDNMNVLLRNVTHVTGADGKPAALVNDAAGKPTATPFLDHLKSFLPTKPWFYAHPGGSGGGMEHGEPAGGVGGSPLTAEKAIEQINTQNAARTNPLAPKVAAKA